MTRLWIGFAAVIVFGSLYPFDFQARSLDPFLISAFLETCCGRPGRGDVLGNVILFAPYGFLGMVSAGAGASMLRQAGFVLITGLALALLLQVIQLYLPSRDENLQDVAWNTIGLAGGLVFGLISHKQVVSARGQWRDLALVPCLLIGCWIAYRLLPLVPSIDWQEIKDSLKPLFLYPRLEPFALARDTVAWLLTAALLQRAQRGIALDALLPVAMLGTFGLEVLIIANVVTVSNLAGAILALGLWWAGLRRLGAQAGLLAFLLAGVLVIQGLRPFEFGAFPAAFAWLPFQGLLGGSMYVNAQAVCEKVFLYGSLVYFLWQTRLPRVAGIILATLLVGLLEGAQIWLAGRTPEITDPLLVLLAAATMTAFERLIPDSRQETSSDLDQSSELVARTVNLRPDQCEVLEALAKRMNGDLSHIAQRMIDQAMELGDLRPSSEAGDSGGQWVQRSLSLRPDQVAYLESHSRKQEVSLSNVVRGIVEGFLEEAES